jgi:hypothetical protein
MPSARPWARKHAATPKAATPLRATRPVPMRKLADPTASALSRAGAKTCMPPSSANRRCVYSSSNSSSTARRRPAVRRCPSAAPRLREACRCMRRRLACRHLPIGRTPAPYRCAIPSTNLLRHPCCGSSLVCRSGSPGAALCCPPTCHSDPSSGCTTTCSLPERAPCHSRAAGWADRGLACPPAVAAALRHRGRARTVVRRRAREDADRSHDSKATQAARAEGVGLRHHSRAASMRSSRSRAGEALCRSANSKVAPPQDEALRRPLVSAEEARCPAMFRRKAAASWPQQHPSCPAARSHAATAPRAVRFPHRWAWQGVCATRPRRRSSAYDAPASPQTFCLPRHALRRPKAAVLRTAMEACRTQAWAADVPLLAQGAMRKSPAWAGAATAASRISRRHRREAADEARRSAACGPHSLRRPLLPPAGVLLLR